MAGAAANQDPNTTTSIREQDELLEAIFRAHAASLRGRLLRSTRDPAVADDLVSESFIRLAAAIRAGRAPLDPPAWLHRVAMNLVVSRARRNTVASRALPGLLDRDVAPSPEDRGRRAGTRRGRSARRWRRWVARTGRSWSWPRAATVPRRSPGSSASRARRREPGCAGRGAGSGLDSRSPASGCDPATSPRWRRRGTTSAAPGRLSSAGRGCPSRPGVHRADGGARPARCGLCAGRRRRDADDDRGR